LSDDFNTSLKSSLEVHEDTQLEEDIATNFHVSSALITVQGITYDTVSILTQGGISVLISFSNTNKSNIFL
jgi:hypothetical protein